MARVSDSQVTTMLKDLLNAPWVDPLDQVFTQVRGLPPEWRGMLPGEMSRTLRRRLDMTQRQLAILSGLPPCKVAAIEGGQDVRLSTLARLFAGFGCGLVLLPVSPLSGRDLWRRTHDLADKRWIPRRRRYPRR